MTPRHAARLTKREQEIVDSFMFGHSIEWIADVLHAENNAGWNANYKAVNDALRKSLRLQDRPKSKARGK